MSSDKKNKDYKEYMARISKEKIPVYQPSLGLEEIQNLNEVVSSNWISEGKFTRQFENLLSNEAQRKFALSFTNATSALITGMKSLGISSGSEVIVPTFAHSADTNAISATQARPRFADIDEKTLCLSVDTIKSVMNEKVQAVLFICAYGNATGIDEVSNFCNENNLILVNDCAPALFGRINNKSIASFGDFSVFSFFADKTITTGEGGMLLTNNPDLIEECNIFKHDGRRERGHELIEKLGYNYRITEFQSAVGVAQFNKGPHFAKRKREILNRYQTLLSKLSKVEVFNFNSNEYAIPHRIIIFVDDSESLCRYLSRKGIGARRLFRPMHSQPVYNSENIFMSSEKIYQRGLELPSYRGLNDEEISHVCNEIKNYLGN